MNTKQRRWLAIGLLSGLAAGVTAELLQRARVRRYAIAHQINRKTWKALQALNVPVEEIFVNVGEVRLNTVLAGPKDGPLIVLLHGFPESWYSWRKQIPKLVNAGYRVAAPNQRGYGLSAKPLGVGHYAIDRLTADVSGLIRALGRERAILVGHDWGGVVAWRFAMDYPEQLEKLIVMNAPHPLAFARELRNGWHQRAKSWYAGFFQLPWLPETLLTFSPAATVKKLIDNTAVRKQTFTQKDLDIMTSTLAQPGSMRAMLNWYRAAVRYPAKNPVQTIDTPTLLIWGEEDVALDKALTYDLTAWAPQVQVHYVLNCGHWVQNEAADEVNQELLKFL